MGEHVNGPLARVLGWFYFGLICVLAVAAPILFICDERRQLGCARVRRALLALTAAAIARDRSRRLRAGGQPVDQEDAAAQHRASGRRGRVPVEHDVRVPERAERRRRHARARHRRDEGQQGHRHARHDRRRQDERPRHRRLEDAPPDQEARRRLLVRAAREEPLQPRPRAPRLPLPRRRHGQEGAAERLHGEGLPRAHARPGAEGLPAHPDQRRDQGPDARRGHRGVREERGGARPPAEGHEAPAS